MKKIVTSFIAILRREISTTDLYRKDFYSKTQPFEAISFLPGTKIRTFSELVRLHRYQVVECKILKGPIQGRRFAKRMLRFC